MERATRTTGEPWSQRIRRMTLKKPTKQQIIAVNTPQRVFPRSMCGLHAIVLLLLSVVELVRLRHNLGCGTACGFTLSICFSCHILQKTLTRPCFEYSFTSAPRSLTAFNVCKRLVPPDASADLCCSSQADATFSITFSQYSCPYFMFATGDLAKWLIASKDAVIGATYANAQRSILRCDATYLGFYKSSISLPILTFKRARRV